MAKCECVITTTGLLNVTHSFVATFLVALHLGFHFYLVMRKKSFYLLKKNPGINYHHIETNYIV